MSEAAEKQQPEINPNLDNFLEILRLVEMTDFDELSAYIDRQATEIEDDEIRKDMSGTLLFAVKKLVAFKREIEDEEQKERKQRSKD